MSLAVDMRPEADDPAAAERHRRTANARALNSGDAGVFQSVSAWFGSQSTPCRVVIVTSAVLALVALAVAVSVAMRGSGAAVAGAGGPSNTVTGGTGSGSSTTSAGSASSPATVSTNAEPTPPAALQTSDGATEGAGLKAGAPVALNTVAFVTGANSMIGSYVCRALLARGYLVHAMVRFRSNLRNLGGILDHSRFRIVYGDLVDPYRMAELIANAASTNPAGAVDTASNPARLGFVYHFAAQAINGVSFTSPSLSTQVNVQGTLHLLEAIKALPEATRKAVRVLVAGSSTEYGRTADWYDGKMPESAPFDPVTPYGVSKVATEYLARMYFHTYGIQTVTARFFIQVAAGGTEHLALQEFSRQIAMIELGLQKPVLRHGNLETQRDMTDIADAAPVVVALAELGVAGEGYNVCTGVAHKVSKLLDIAIKLAKVPITREYDTSRARPFDEKMMLGDPAKLVALTGWKPSVNMEKTTKQVLDYWRAEVDARYPPESRKLVEGATPAKL